MINYENFVGKILDERYRITGIVGVGGMAVVFKAEDIIMNRVVAIKVLKNDAADVEKSMQRFLNESKAVAMLSHPNIVSIYDVSVKDEVKYIVMEYAESTTLKDYIGKVGRLGWKEALHYTKQILEALEHAHEKGVVHRDVKPQNMLLMKDGSIKVADFGIAKLPNNETITDADSAIGTVHYISPEQAEGKDVTPQSDIYSVGVMLYEMVTGKLPFDSDTPVSVALMHITDEAVPPKDIIPTLPDGLQFIIMQAMDKNPAKRFASCDEMQKYIKELIKDPEVVFAPLPERAVSAVPAADKGEEKILTPKRKKEPEIKTKKHRNTMMPIILGVFLAFLIVGIVSLIIVGKTAFGVMFDDANGNIDPSELVEVDKLVGSLYDDALKDELHEKGYGDIKLIYEYSTDFDENVIIKQNLEPGKRQRRGFSIVLTLSKGANTFVLDDYSYKEYRAVQRELAKLGVKQENIIIEQVQNEFIPVGQVIETKPKAGETVSAADKITLVISKGSEIETNEVPNLEIMPLDKALKLIEQYKFTVGEITEVYSDVEKGYVVHQSVDAGSTAQIEFTKIDLEVSKGPDPNAIVEPEPEPEPEHNPDSDGENTENQ